MKKFVAGGISLMFILPFLNPIHDLPLTTFHTEAIALMLGAIVILPAMFTDLEFPPMAKGLIALAVLFMIQAETMLNFPLHGYVAAVYCVWSAALLSIAASFSIRPMIIVLQFALVIGAFLASLTAFAIFYDLDFFGYKLVTFTYPRITGMYGTVGQKNIFALYECIGLASLLYLVSENKISALIAALLSLPIIYGIAACGSGSAIVFIFIIAIIVAARINSTIKEEPKLFWSFVFVIIALAGFTMLPTHDDFTSWGRVANSTNLIDTVNPRFYLIHEAWRMFTSNPLIGIGFGEFARALPLDSPRGDHYAHNIVLQMLAETGIVGFMCIAIPFVLWLKSFPWKAFHTNNAAWGLSIIAMIAVHSLIEFSLYYAQFLGIFAVVLGLNFNERINIHEDHAICKDPAAIDKSDFDRMRRTKDTSRYIGMARSRDYNKPYDL